MLDRLNIEMLNVGIPDFVISWLRELGIGIVVYSPLGRGFLSSGPKMMENFTKEDYRQVCTH